MEKESFRFPSLRGRITADAVIAGGGLTGLMTALRLSSAGLHTAVLEAERLCGGMSAYCWGTITLSTGLQYESLESKRGLAFACAYAQTQMNAFDILKKLAAKTDAVWREEAALVFSGRTGKLRAEASAMRRCGLFSSLTLPEEEAELEAGLLRTFPAASLCCFRLLEGVLKLCLEQKVTFFEQSRVLSCDADTMYTAAGSVRAPVLVLATGFPIVKWDGGMAFRLEQRKCWTLHLEGSADWDGLLVSEDGRMLLQSVPEGCVVQLSGAYVGCRQNDRVLRAEKEALFQKLRRMRLVACRTAQDCFSSDGLPFIGPLGESEPGLYAATGYGRRGLIGSVMAAEAIGTRVLGLPPSGFEIYGVQRSWQGMMPAHILTRYLRGALADRQSPRCPHMGCRMVYHEASRAWECPCHGSRFDDIGRLLNGPANRDAVLKSHGFR